MAISIDSDLSFTSGSKLNGLPPATQNGQPLIFEQLTGGTSFFTSPPSGTYFNFADYNIAPTTQAQSLNNLKAVPGYIRKAVTISKVLQEVTTAGSGANIRLGIYADNGAGYPGDLIVNSDVGDISSATIGVKTNSFTFNITLQPGLYWLAFNAGGAASTLRAIPPAGLVNILGANPAGGTNSQYTNYTISQTFGAMPPTFPTAATKQANFGAPWTMFLVA